MNHPCYRCGHIIEDGKPFCPECGAAQIRVVLPETPPVLAAERGILAATTENYGTLSAEPTSALSHGASSDLKSCALAASVMIALTFLGLNPFVAALGAGWLAVIFTRRGRAGPLTPSKGARLGAITGLFLFGISTIFETLAVVLLHKGAELRIQMLSKVQQVSERYPGPQVQPFLDFVKTSEGFAFMMVGSVIFGLIGFILLGSAGGAICAAFLGRRQRP